MNESPEQADDMRVLLDDLRNKGLAGASVVFTLAALCATGLGILISRALHVDAGLSRELSIAAFGILWLLPMIMTWRFLHRARQSWPDTLTSASLFHAFQFITIGLCICFAALSGGLHSKELLWCGFGIEITVALFYFSYAFLGITLRYRIPPSTLPGFLLALGSVCWSSQHLPKI